ncbi:MAG: aspartate kinase [Bacteroidetes bacterium]|nr:MAG: aspartate kinase [Bacteroidota bacterium]
MLVMKFGGASVKNAAAVQNVANIIRLYTDQPCLVVLSAMDKTTNHLEHLAFLARDNRELDAKDQFQRIMRFHLGIIRDLFGDASAPVEAKVQPYFNEMERIVTGILMLEEFPPRIYDRIVAYGELISTVIVSAYLEFADIPSFWLDARQVIKTDATWKQAGVIWSLTEENIRRGVAPLVQPGRVVITQGFIGSTTGGHTTTLGREGSDYTGSIFAHCLNAESLTVWKDVKGILNGDPRIRQHTVKLDKLSYEEAVEMTFYGASVIHPKTIKPLYNKGIPLKVKCFLDVEAEGSVISFETNPEPVASYIVKKAQTFIRIKPKDFSFMEERLMQEIFDHLHKSNVKVSLVQNSAISLMLCVDEKLSENAEFEALLLDKFTVEIRNGLQLYTIINFSVKDLKEASEAVMVQQHENKLYLVK